MNLCKLTFGGRIDDCVFDPLSSQGYVLLHRTDFKSRESEMHGLIFAMCFLDFYYSSKNRVILFCLSELQKMMIKQTDSKKSAPSKLPKGMPAGLPGMDAEELDLGEYDKICLRLGRLELLVSKVAWPDERGSYRIRTSDDLEEESKPRSTFSWSSSPLFSTTRLIAAAVSG